MVPNSGQGFGSKVSVLAYPAVVFDTALNTMGRPDVSTTFSVNSGTYVLGKPTQFEITQAEYIKLKNGELFDWGNDPTGRNGDYSFDSLASLSAAALIVLNKGQTTIDNLFNGYYIGLKDNTLLNPASAFDSVRNVLTVAKAPGDTGSSSYITVPTSRLEFQLTATPEGGSNPATNSISQVMEDRVVGYNIGGREFDDTLNIGIFKLRQSVFSKEANNLDYLFEEGYNGSIGAFRQRNSENGGAPVNFSLETVEDGSRNIDIVVNPNVSNALKGAQLKDNGEPKHKVRVLGQAFSDALSGAELSASALTWAGLPADFITATLSAAAYSKIQYADALLPLGSYGDVDLASKQLGDIPGKLDRALDRVRNDRKFDISMIAEAGLGTINTYMETASASDANFDDTKTTTAIEALRTSSDLTNTFARSSYMNVFNKFATFAGPVKDGGRGDILFIADPIRQLVVTGKNSKVQKDPNKNFYTDIYWAVRHQFELANTSYATVFANWMSVPDNYTGLNVWVPSSGFAAAKMASTDAAVGPWGAPAGFNRGVITDASDIAVTPNQRQRDDLYTANLNPIANFADQGNVFFGQKTLLRKPSAFDRINVRRTFLYLEKITKKTMQFFLFENNTLFTRTRVTNTLTPFFERVKAADGLYDFMIVCDDRNNTAEVIDQNELVVDIYLKPVRTAEFILVNFYATRTDANFEELIGS